MMDLIQSKHLFFVNPLFFFWVFSVALMVSAVGVVAMRNIIHSALMLCLSFIATAGIFIVLGAEFLAAAEVLIYAGAITILILFAIMLSQRIIGRDIIYKNRQSIWASFVSLAIMGLLIVIFATGNWNYKIEPSTTPMNNIRLIGRSLMVTYPLAFWVASFLLTITIIGSLILAKKD